jgi:hypothetical protein
MSINANDQLDLKGSCLIGCNGNSSINTYNLYMHSSITNQWIPFTNSSYYYQTDLTPNSFLTIRQNLFEDFSSQIIWKVELVVNNENVYGSTSMLLYVNFPPKSGSCDINPKNGTTSSQFQIICKNWVDSNGDVTKYSFYSKKKIFDFRKTPHIEPRQKRLLYAIVFFSHRNFGSILTQLRPGLKSQNSFFSNYIVRGLFAKISSKNRCELLFCELLFHFLALLVASIME